MRNSWLSESYIVAASAGSGLVKLKPLRQSQLQLTWHRDNFGFSPVPVHVIHGINERGALAVRLGVLAKCGIYLT